MADKGAHPARGALTLFGVLAAAKLAAVWGRELPDSPWTPIALLGQDAAVATAFGPRRETKNTSTTAKTDSMAISRTMGIASRRMARPIGPLV